MCLDALPFFTRLALPRTSVLKKSTIMVADIR